MQRVRAIPVATLGSGSCQNRLKGWIILIINNKYIKLIQVQAAVCDKQSVVYHQPLKQTPGLYYIIHTDILIDSCGATHL
jgi:hypothetical protein